MRTLPLPPTFLLFESESCKLPYEALWIIFCVIKSLFFFPWQDSKIQIHSRSNCKRMFCFTSNTCRCGLACLPLILMFLSLSTFIITYLISFFRHDTSWFPTISDTADKSPESNVFGVLFNLCAALSFLVIFIRYLQLRHDVDWNESDRQLLLVVNKVAVAFGAISSFGACIVANFQVKRAT